MDSPEVTHAWGFHQVHPWPSGGVRGEVTQRLPKLADPPHNTKTIVLMVD